MAAIIRLLAAGVFAVLLTPAQPSVPFYGDVIGSAGGGRTLYASTGPGYFKSVDDGATWSPLYLTEPGLAQPALGTFAVDPANESNLYLATAPNDGALWKSTNAGATWRKANTGLPAAGTVTQSYLLIASNGALYLRIDTALYKSRDGGDTWVKLAAPLPGNARAFDINRGTPTQMLHASGGTIWRSTDEGATWRSVASLTLGTSGIGGILTEPAYPEVVYVAVAGGTLQVNGRVVAGVHTSTDGGVSFTSPTSSTQPIRLLADHAGGSNLYTDGSSGTICRSQSRGTNFTCIPASAFVPAANPTSTRPKYVERRNGNILHVTATRGTERRAAMYRSTDAGQTFRPLEGTARVTFAQHPITLAVAPDVTASVPLPVTAVDLPGAALEFTAKASGAAWFSLSSSSGQTPGTLSVTFRSAGLPAGSRHEGSIVLESAHAAPLTIPVVLEVTKPVLAPAPVYSFSVLAGNGQADAGADGLPAHTTSIGDVAALAVDRDKNAVFIAHNRLRRVNAAGTLGTLAGNGTIGTAPDGTALLQAPLNRPESLAFDSQGTLYFGEAGGVVRRIASGALGTALRAGQINTAGTSLLATDPQDRLWLANAGRFFRYTPPGSLLTLALTPEGTTFRGPTGMAIDAQGNLYVAPTQAQRIYKITPEGAVSLFAGNGTATISDGVPARASGLDSPTALATDARGNLLFVETRRNLIRLINPAGIIYTVAAPEGVFPRHLATDSESNVYAAGTRYVLKAVAPPLVIPTPAPPVRNLASGEPALSPGTLFTLTGEHLALLDETAAAGSTWPLELGGARVTVNGAPVPLGHASPGRLNGYLPPGLEPGVAKLVVTVNGVASPELEIPLAPSSPGLFTLPEDPEQAAGAEVAEGTAVVLVTGYGRAATEGFQVFFDDEPLDGLEIVPAPGALGVGRAKFALPADTAPGRHSVRLRVGEAESNTVFVTVI